MSSRNKKRTPNIRASKGINTNGRASCLVSKHAKEKAFLNQGKDLRDPSYLKLQALKKREKSEAKQAKKHAILEALRLQIDSGMATPEDIDLYESMTAKKKPNKLFPYPVTSIVYNDERIFKNKLAMSQYYCREMRADEYAKNKELVEKCLLELENNELEFKKNCLEEISENPGNEDEDDEEEEESEEENEEEVEESEEKYEVVTNNCNDLHVELENIDINDK